MYAADSARATSATESRFRINAPNSCPRAMIVMALNADAAALVAGLGAGSWRGTTFLTATMPAMQNERWSFASWLRTITGQAVDLGDAVARADVVQMLTFVGADAPAASLIGKACGLHGTKTSGLVIDAGGAPSSALSHSLHALRPWAVTLSLIGSVEDVGEILHALGGQTACPPAIVAIGLIEAFGLRPGSNVVRRMVQVCTCVAALFDKLMVAGMATTMAHSIMESSGGVTIPWSQSNCSLRNTRR